MDNEIREISDLKKEDARIDLIRLYHAMIDKIWIIFISMIVGATLMFGYSKWMISPQYTAQSMIYVLGSSTSITSMADIQIGSILSVDFETIAKSRTVVEELIEEMDLQMDYHSMVSLLSVEKLADTRILRFTVKYSDPKIASEIANKWTEITASRIEKVMKTDRPSILERAVAPLYPISPNIQKNTVKGAAFGGGLAALIVALRFLLNDRIYREEEIEHYLGLSVLAVLPMER